MTQPPHNIIYATMRKGKGPYRYEYRRQEQEYIPGQEATAVPVDYRTYLLVQTVGTGTRSGRKKGLAEHRKHRQDRCERRVSHVQSY
jgi:hypothetical protein